LPEAFDDEKEGKPDEKPTVVVLNSGDLTAEEADAFKKQKEEGRITDSKILEKKLLYIKIW